MATRRASRDGVPSSSSGIDTFSAAVRPARRLKSWKTKPMERRRSCACSRADSPATSTPPMTAVPLVADSSVPAIVSMLLLPDPLGPITATSSPATTVRSTLRRAWTVLAPSP